MLHWWISKINNIFVDNTEDLDNDNYSMTPGSLWNYYRDKVHNEWCQWNCCLS